MLRIGLTGGIGCGKSIVAQHFAALNVPYIDADNIAHQLTANGSQVLDIIEASFGHEVRLPDGELNRAWLRQLIFSDTKARAKLEAILHPLILDHMHQQLQILSDVPYVLLVIPLLLEKPIYRNLVDRILVVDCSAAQQHARVSQRDGLDERMIDAILATQMPREKRLALADDVLINTGDVTALHDKVLALHQAYLALSAKTL